MAALVAFGEEKRRPLLDALWFEEAYVPVSALPDLAAHLAANAEQYATALAAEDSGVVLYVNVHAGRFVREIGAALAAGFVVTTDYGATTWDLVQGARRGEFPFRVYGDQQDFLPRPNDPYAAPGTQDMTADVNFTDLAAAGEAAGLKVVHFGHERDLVGDDLPEVSPQRRRPAGCRRVPGKPRVQVLVLGKGTVTRWRVTSRSARSPSARGSKTSQKPDGKRYPPSRARSGLPGLFRNQTLISDRATPNPFEALLPV
jgi:hypothetical protein